MTDPTPPSILPSANSVDAMLRHGYTAAATGFTILAALALIPADKVAPALEALHHIGDDVKDIMGNLSVLWVIVGPVIVGFVLRASSFAASLKGQLRSITTNPAVHIPEPIVVPKAVADAVPSDKVVSL